MRTPRIAILFFFVLACLFLLARSVTNSPRSTSTRDPAPGNPDRSSAWGFMYYNAPFSLFPPNAAISLTDDNSTSFAARPAAFGPKLAQKGLSGQLWVGSGFAEDTLDGDGELGCSDVPRRAGASAKKSAKLATQRDSAVSMKFKHQMQDLDADSEDNDVAIDDDIPQPLDPDDGTDDFLHVNSAAGPFRHDSSIMSHADIQSIQEAAEIQGKVVLLMRGGCGFLEKVMWAQRRGAIAVIVGDNQKGGPLIQMFARGDEVENVTIPSVFTARTTAQLLSSLTQPGSFMEDMLNDNGDPILKVQQGVHSNRKKKTKQGKSSRKTSSSNAVSKKGKAPSRAKRSIATDDPEEHATSQRSAGLLSRMFSWSRTPRSIQGKSRPPNSGHLDWIMVEDWNDESDKMLVSNMGKRKKSAKKESTNDGFVIGVQDWRDPDLVDKAGSTSSKDKAGPGKLANAKSVDKGSNEAAHGPKGGIVPPSSGEYSRGDSASAADDVKDEVSSSGRKLMSKLFGDHEEDDAPDDEDDGSGDHDNEPAPSPHDPADGPREGLWVTIMPTSSASPFLDTLLVLVISPLITLTIVYALLILRARIRRRRWRAPKSLVEQLPVRTYHTVATTPTVASRLPSPSSTSVTTPLLQQTQQQGSQPQPVTPVRPRPRSRTTTGIPESEGLLTPTAAIPTPRTPSRNGRRSEREKGAGGFSAEWRKYMGRQIECVVCLEEYIDGVSKVMSLPCGHEFHADCITPWLTTRRRTCPICKGDVVRSMAHGSSSMPRYESFEDDEDSDDEEGEASGSRSPRRDADLERGILTPEPREGRRANRQDGWFGFFTGGSRARSPSPSPSPSRSPSPEGRDR